jgi:cell fate regulator YaaT (PSP1 superfamily)
LQGRFNWNLYPKTARVIEAAELTSVQENQELLEVYKTASTMFKKEGGIGKLEMKIVKVHIKVNFRN